MDVSSVFPDKYLKELLSVGVRSDGRGPDVGRSVTINIGSLSTCDGSSLVSVGNTLVTCGVKAELLSTTSTDTRRGILEYSSCSSADSASGPPPTHVQVATHQLQHIMEQVVDLDSLIVADSDLVWVLHVDVVCLTSDGSLLDAATLAATAALNNASLPSVGVAGSSGPTLQHETPAARVPMTTIGMVTVTFALFNNWCLLDPVLSEELVSEGKCTVTVSLHPQEVWGCDHQGKVKSEEELGTVVELAYKRATQLQSLLEKVISTS